MILILLIFVLIHFSKCIDHDIFQFGPFNDNFDEESGERLISDDWRLYGSAKAFESFIRLTPDRQSKQGAIWSRGPTESTSLNAVLEFRIAGQGKKLFGDGMGVWMINQPFYSSGFIHGSNEYFNGIGLIIDTYKVRSDPRHRDIGLVVNNGNRDYRDVASEIQADDLVGCDASPLRYHHKSGEYSAAKNSSRVLINIVGTKVTVLVDPKANGEWKRCFEHSLFLPSDWLSPSHIGITGTTGDLADNHDVIAFKTFKTLEEAKAYPPSREMSPPEWLDTSPIKGETAKDKLNVLEERFDVFNRRIELTEHHLEHELINARDLLNGMLNRLDDAETNILSNIAHIEELMYMDSEISGGLGNDDDLADYDPSTARKNEILSHFRARLDETTVGHKQAVEEAIDSIREGQKTWKYALFFGITVVILAAIGAYYYIRMMIKKGLI